MDAPLLKAHPTLDGVLVRDDGYVLVPASGTHAAHWTYGYADKYGYLRVKVCGVHRLVHRLVAEAFLDNPDGLPTVDHVNRVKTDNRACNLRYANHKTQADNRDAVDASIAEYGVRECDDKNAYNRAVYRENRGFSERCRERRRARYAHLKDMGKRCRTCPDGKRRMLTDGEYDAMYGTGGRQ